MTDTYKTDLVELRLGRWQDVLGDVVECDPETFDKAVKRLKRGYTPDLFSSGE